jgi:hypothetical protein
MSESLINKARADDLAGRWIAAWNRHDLDAILALYRDDFTMASPYIMVVANEASGRLRGKPAVGAYWRRALERFPDVHFDLLHVLTGVNSLTLVYQSNRSGLVAEVFTLDEAGLISTAAAYYLPMS